MTEFKAEIYACNAHAKINQLYDGMPYRHHLKMAVDIGNQFKHLIPKKDWKNVVAGIWCHDIIEDAHQTFNDVKININEIVAEYAFACTNEKGKTRAERANDIYYAGILSYKHTLFIKLADRIANVLYCKNTHNDKILNMYKKEYNRFKSKLHDGRFQEMWDYLESLLNS